MEEAKQRARQAMTLREAAAVGRLSASRLRNTYTHPTHPVARLVPAAHESLRGTRSVRALAMAGRPGYHGTAMRMASRPAALMQQFLMRGRRPPVSLSALARSTAPRTGTESRVNRLRGEFARANNTRASPRRVKSVNRHTRRKSKSKGRSA